MPKQTYTSDHPPFAVTVDLVLLTLREGVFCVLLVDRGEEPFKGCWALPGGFVHPDEDLADAAHSELEEETGVRQGSVRLEQLATFGTPDRDPRQRVVSVAHLAVGAGMPEDVAGGSDAADARWWPVDEALGLDLAFDHADILSSGVERVRAKLEYSNLALSFVPEEFTLSEVQAVYEAVWGSRLDASNFARKVTRTPGFVLEVGGERRGGRGRPARLYQAGGETELHPPMTRE